MNIESEELNTIYNTSQISKWNINKNLVSLLEDVIIISDHRILNSGIYSYIINNSNYSNDILYPNKYLMNQSSCCSLFIKFKNNKEFCIK